MTKIEREDIKLISRHSNLSEKRIDELLKKHLYPSKASWSKFLRLLFVGLGVGFTTTGIVFFFAYNWADLHKFIKIGLVEGLIILLMLVILGSKLSLDIKNILLTGSAILVGVLFAVFGQIYQTGANAYDFFLGWTIFIAIWVFISNFAPLWLIFITLINTTVVLYSQQVAHDWSEIFICTLLFTINVLFLTVSLFGNKVISAINFPNWFSNLLALASVIFSTIGIIIGIFDEGQFLFWILLILTMICYTIGIRYGLDEKRGFYLSIIPFSVIIIFTAYLIYLSSDASMFFVISLFVVGSVTFVIKNLINLQKEWKN